MLIPAFIAFGVGGWVFENVVRGPTFSKAFNGAKVPFLPVYAFGGVTVLIIAPKVAHLPVYQRFLVYGAATVGVEAIAGIIDRMDGDKPSWDYDGSPVNLKYAVLWAGASMAIEQMVVALASKKG